jgi:hypothetical protein
MEEEYFNNALTNIYEKVLKKYPEFNNKFALFYATINIIKTYQDVDNISDMIKDYAFVKQYYDGTCKEIQESVMKINPSKSTVDGLMRETLGEYYIDKK